MEDFVFQGLGTHWNTTADGETLKDDVKTAILEYVQDFESRFSRFLLDSENNAFRNVQAGEYIVSEEFSQLLAIADQLRILTDGVYDPGVGMLLESAGYGAQDSKAVIKSVEEFTLPTWSLKERTLTLDGPVVFDFGGFGKGYCIDQVSKILKHFGYEHFIVNGGGDMFGTTKKDGSPWKIAIEYPGKKDMALGTVMLENQGIAVSDSFRRQWGRWHHLVNPQEKETVKNVVGGVAVADSALNADCMTSALFFSAPANYSSASKMYNAQYLLVQGDGLTKVSSLWRGELF